MVEKNHSQLNQKNHLKTSTCEGQMLPGNHRPTFIAFTAFPSVVLSFPASPLYDGRHLKQCTRYSLTRSTLVCTSIYGNLVVAIALRTGSLI